MPNVLTRYLAAHLPSCREVTRWASDAMDRPLPLGTRLALRVHVLICTWCRRYLRQLVFLRQAVRSRPERLTDVEPHAGSPGLSPEARARIRLALRDRSR